MGFVGGFGQRSIPTVRLMRPAIDEIPEQLTFPEIQ
jgi:hypothetical protein